MENFEFVVEENKIIVNVKPLAPAIFTAQEVADLLAQSANETGGLVASLKKVLGTLSVGLTQTNAIINGTLQLASEQGLRFGTANQEDQASQEA